MKKTLTVTQLISMMIESMSTPPIIVKSTRMTQQEMHVTLEGTKRL